MHIVLFRLRSELSAAERDALVLTLSTACREIPSVRRCRIGRRYLHGRPYEQAMREDLPYAAIIEFDDHAGLKTYLEHPAHDELGSRFTAAIDARLIYDFEMQDSDRVDLLTGES